MIQAPTDAQLSELARAEFSRREMCRRNLSHYWRCLHSPRTPGAWQIDLCRRLQRFTEAVERKESPCMMVFAPPQRGKSLTVSQSWPAWMMGKHPNWNFILASYGERLAAKNGGWVRNALTSPKHCEIFQDKKCRLRDDSQAKDTFTTLGGGQFISRGRGGGTTGEPATVFIVDDPFADQQEGESELIQETVWDWFWSVAETRLSPGGGKLVMNTRWNEKDLAGRLLRHSEENPEADQWEVVSYPAIAEANDIMGRKVGEPLHPEYFTIEQELKKKANLPPRVHMSMYQQRPTSETGTYFDIGKLNEMDPSYMPKMTKYYQAWDFALKPSQDADYSVGVNIGLDHLGRYWLTDLVRGQWHPAETAKQITRFWHKHQAQMVFLEGGGTYYGIEPSLKAEMRKSGLWVPHEEISHGGKSKDVRAISIRGIVNGGNLYVPTKTPWLNNLKTEMASFPNGVNDDQVDALSYLGLKTMIMKTNEDRTPLSKQFPAVERSQAAKRGIRQLIEAQKSGGNDGSDW